MGHDSQTMGDVFNTIIKTQLIKGNNVSKKGKSGKLILTFNKP